MKILIINNSGIVSDNKGLFVFKAEGEMATYLQEAGNEVEIFQRKVVSDSHSISTFNLIENRIKATTIKTFSPKILNYVYAYLVGIWRILHNDFVYIYYPSNFKWLGPIARILGKKYGLYLRGSKGVETKSSKFLYRYAKVVFCVSPIFTKMVNEAGGNGIDKKPEMSFEYKDIVRGREYVSKDEYSILYLGRIDLDKGLVELLEASKIIRERGYKFNLDFVGDGSPLKLLNNKAVELKVSDIVTFHGMIMDKKKVKQFYLNADVYVLPTYHEGFARTLCEAMIFGTPVITTFVGGIPGFMKEKYNALRIEPKSTESIVEKLMYAMNNYEKMGELAKKGTIKAGEIVDPNRPSHSEQLNQILKEG